MTVSASDHLPMLWYSLCSMINSDWLTSRSQASPQKTALIIGEQQWTYAELQTAVSHLVKFLHQRNLQPGDFVAVLLPNNFAYVCLIHALARLGAVLVPLNTRLTFAELSWQVAHVGCKWVITDQKELLIDKCTVLVVSEHWFTGTAAGIVQHPPLAAHNLQSVVFTSGTSGQPKGAMLTFGNHFYSAMSSAYRLGVQPHDVWLSVLPLYHVGGLAVIFRSCLYGTAVSLHPRFDLDAVNHDLNVNPITFISLVPTMLHRLLETRAHWPVTLRLILLGGAAATSELVERANALPRKGSGEQPSPGLPSPLIATTYGLTETASQVATMLPSEVVHKSGSVGKPLLFTQVKIVDEQGHEQPPGAYGEIVVTGPTVMTGYFAKDEGLKVKDGSGVVQNTIHTGDIGYLDGDGDLWLVQRRTDLIVTGGENVYPAEVEGVLRVHTAVAAVCVVGVPHPEWGQQVAAMVVLVEETAVSAADLIQFCRQHLASYKIPRHIQFVAQLPLTASGKIQRQRVAALLQGRPD